MQRSAQNGTEHHIKRSKFRWSGHLVRMADDGIYNVLSMQRTGRRPPNTERPTKEMRVYKDVLNATLMSCGAPNNSLHGRSQRQTLGPIIWRHTCHAGLLELVDQKRRSPGGEDSETEGYPGAIKH